MDLYVILCGVTLKKIKLDLQYRQEEQVIFLVLKSWTNFYTLMALIIFLGPINYVLRDISYSLNRNYLLFGLHQIIFIGWEI